MLEAQTGLPDGEAEQLCVFLVHRHGLRGQVAAAEAVPQLTAQQAVQRCDLELRLHGRLARVVREVLTVADERVARVQYEPLEVDHAITRPDGEVRSHHVVGGADGGAEQLDLVLPTVRCGAWTLREAEERLVHVDAAHERAFALRGHHQATVHEDVHGPAYGHPARAEAGAELSFGRQAIAGAIDAVGNLLAQDAHQPRVRGLATPSRGAGQDRPRPCGLFVHQLVTLLHTSALTT